MPMTKALPSSAAELHSRVPPNWYDESIRKNPFQRFWHHRRFKEVGSLIEPTGGSMLDIGCADGVFTNVLLEKSNAAQIIGIDVLEDSVRWATDRWKRESRLSFRVADAHILPFLDASFDTVYCLEALEHVFDPGLVLRESLRVLKPGGYAVFLVPTDSLLFRAIWFGWTRLRGAIGDGPHIQSFRNRALGTLARENGFAIGREHLFLLGMLYAVK